MKKSPFFDFFNRHGLSEDVELNSFDNYLAINREDVDYINWNEFLLPNDYGDAEYEYDNIRNKCALFDISPIRKFRIIGSAAGQFLDILLTRTVSTVSSMRGIYVVFCNEDGTLKDDAIVYKYADDDYMLMPSDIDHSVYFEKLRKASHISNDDISILDCSDSWTGVAIQGPLSAQVVRQMGFSSVDQLKPFEVRDFPFANGEMKIARMGFTADLGYECWFRLSLSDEFKTTIKRVRSELDLDIPGYGLTALETCRIEGGFIVAGWDFSTEADPTPGFERSPFEVGLGWLVKLGDHNFVGKDALTEEKKSGSNYVLRQFVTDARIKPEDGIKIYGPQGSNDVVGSAYCSTWSWGLQQTIGNASIKASRASLETARMEIDGEYIQVSLKRGPLINLQRRNKVPAELSG